MQSLNVWHSELNTIVQHCLCTTRLFFLELMAKMPYTMECFFQSHLVLSAGPPAFHAAESPFELSECKPQTTHIKSGFAFGSFICLAFVCIQNSTKNTWMFLTFCIEVRDSPHPVMPRISELEVHPGSPPSMMLNASSMLLTSENVNFWILLVIFNERLGEAFKFGMNIQRCYTRLQDISIASISCLWKSCVCFAGLDFRSVWRWVTMRQQTTKQYRCIS